MGEAVDLEDDQARLVGVTLRTLDQQALNERFPVLVQMQQYAGGKRTRVIRVIEDEDDWKK